MTEDKVSHDVEKNTAVEVRQKEKSVRTMNFSTIDAALSEIEKTIKENSDIVKNRLAANSAIPGEVLRGLSRANGQKLKLVMRRITLLMELGEPGVMDLIDKLMKFKAPKI